MCAVCQDVCGIRVPLVRLSRLGTGPVIVPLSSHRPVLEGPAPFLPRDVATLTPTVGHGRGACGPSPLECYGGFIPAEAACAAGEFDTALRSFNLRLALLQAQGDAASHAAANAVIGIANTLLRMVRASSLFLCTLRPCLCVF